MEKTLERRLLVGEGKPSECLKEQRRGRHGENCEPPGRGRMYFEGRAGLQAGVTRGTPGSWPE